MDPLSGPEGSQQTSAGGSMIDAREKRIPRKKIKPKENTEGKGEKEFTGC